MRLEQAYAIAKAMGRLKGQEGIDEETRLYIISDVENAIITMSRVLNGKDRLQEFRELAKSD